MNGTISGRFAEMARLLEIDDSGQGAAVKPGQISRHPLLLVGEGGLQAIISRLLVYGDEAFAIVGTALNLNDILQVLDQRQVDVALFHFTGAVDIGLALIEDLHHACPSLPIVVLAAGDKPSDLALQVLTAGAHEFLWQAELSSARLVTSLRAAISRVQAVQREQHQHGLRTGGVDALQTELSSARRMQMALLPPQERIQAIAAHHGVDIAGVLEPSLVIGGDLWGAIDVGEGRVAVYTFDFSGHGFAAALNTFRLHTLIHDHLELAHAPAEMLARLDVGLAPLLPRGQYATIFYGVIDLWQDSLLWAAAGTPPPLFVPHGADPEPLENRGIPLGILQKCERQQHIRMMLPGDSLILYSDALTESPLPNGDLLGEEGVWHMVRQMTEQGEDARTHLARWLNRFYASIAAPVQDDLTAVWVTRRPTTL